VAGVRLARLTVTERLRVLDLRGTAATGAGTIAAAHRLRLTIAR
jgi:hypothetical protein